MSDERCVNSFPGDFKCLESIRKNFRGHISARSCSYRQMSIFQGQPKFFRGKLKVVMRRFYNRNSELEFLIRTFEFS